MRAIFSSYATPSAPLEKSANWPMSVPATKALSPAAFSTMTRISSSASARSQAS